MRTSEPHQAATKLAAREPTIARLADRYGLPTFVPPTGTDFAFVAGALIHPQLSNRSANAILGRLRDALGGEITAAGVLGLSDGELRRVGMSLAKILSLRALATKVDEGSVVLDGAVLAEWDDDAVVAELTKVRGVGRWTAEMFLILQLLRLDVWPTGDLSVRKGYPRAGRCRSRAPWSSTCWGCSGGPYRTVAAWHCWVVLGQEPGP